MSVKMSGAEYKRFYSDPEFWPEGVWNEDAEITVDGNEQPDGIDVETLSDNAVVIIEDGVVCGPQWEFGDSPSLETYFRRWRKKQTTTFLTVECDHAKLEAVKAAIKAAGGKISK